VVAGVIGRKKFIYDLWGITTDDYDRKCQELKNKQYKNNDIMKNYLKA